LFKKFLINGILISIILVTSGCDVFNQAVQNAIEQTQTNSAKTEVSANRSTPTENPISILFPTVTRTSKPDEVPYIRASEISRDLAGQSIEICGKVTFSGKENCSNCENGYFAYLILDDNFYIISYDWTFNASWIDSYIIAKDTVETMGSKPIFVFGGKEGWDGSECEIMPDGFLSCEGGDYFQFVTKCGN